MNKDQLFQSLSEEDETTLLELLRSAYDFLSHDDRHTIFGQHVKEMPPAQIDGEGLHQQTRKSSQKQGCIIPSEYDLTESVLKAILPYWLTEKRDAQVMLINH
jgi:hypothetical protein